MEFGVFDHLDRTGGVARRVLRGSPADRGGLRSRRLLRLSSRRASLDAARHGAVAERVPVGGRAAHPPAAVRPAGLGDAAASSAAADRGNLHARPVERRPAGDRLRPRLGADRDRVLRRRSGRGAGDLRRSGRDRDEGTDPEGARSSGQALHLRATCRWRSSRCRSRIRRSGTACTCRTAPNAPPGASSMSSASTRRPKRGCRSSATASSGRETQPAGTPLPKLGLGRFVVVAPTDAEALALARRAYPAWHASFTYLFRRHGRSQSHPRPATFDLVMERGQGIAGLAADGCERARRATRRDRLQLHGRAIHLRRSHRGRVPALDRPVRRRGDAGAADMRGRGRYGTYTHLTTG